MKNDDIIDLIESYLANTLPGEERRDVEQRIAQDEEFRREVQLHRELQENFGDSARWRLRSTLMEVMKEPISSKDPSFNSRPATTHKMWKWFILLAAVFVGIGFWYWLKPAKDKPMKDPIEAIPSEEPLSPMAEVADDSIVTETPEEISTIKQQPEQPLQIAMADPADFIPNPSMEAFVNSAFRGHDDISLTMTSPANSKSFTPNSKGETVVLLNGQLTGVPNDSPIALVLNVFNNEDVSKPLIGLPVDLLDEPAGWTFEVRQQLKFPLGLYYFTIESEGEMLYAGKFTIGKLKK